MKKSVFLSGLLVSCLMLLSIAANATAPVDTTNPASVTVCSGTTAKFSVGVSDTTTGASPVNYKWQVSTDGSTWSYITDVPPYSNSTTDTLSVAAGMALNGYWYRSIDSNNDGMDTSLAAHLTVDTLSAGTISGPAATCVGSSVTLLDAVTGGTWTHISHIVDTLNPGTGVLTGLAQGFDTVTYVVTNICGTATATAAIRVDTTVTGLPITGPAVTCVGHTIDLMDANVSGTHTWSVSNASASITSSGVLTGLSDGRDTVTYAFTNGCNFVSDSVVIRIDTPLSAGVISGATGVCAGSWIPLSESVTGGIWISGSAAAVVDGSGHVTGVSSGTASISYLLSNGCGSSIATYTVTVSAAAGPITGGDSVGIGATIALSNGAPGGTWSVAAGAIATVDSDNIIQGVAAGTTTVTYTVTNLCGTFSATMTLYVGAAPSPGLILGSDSVCVGGTMTLSDPSAPGGIWTSSQDTLATIDSSSGVVHGFSAGFVIITYTVRSAFGSSIVTHVVYIASRPVIRLFGPASFGLGYNAIIAYPYGGTFSETVDSLGTFIGFSSGSDSSGAYVIAYFIAGNHGTNTIHYTVHTPCGDADSSLTYHIAGAGVSPVNGSASVLNVYPNPNTGAFIVNLSSPNTEPASVIITNIVGEKVKEFTISTNTSANIKLDQPAGIYFMSVNTAGGRYTAKINITN